MSAAGIEWSLSNVIASEAFADYNFVFNQFSGLHVRLVNFLSQTHPIRNRRDIENYLARLELIAAQIDEGIAQAKDAAARGFLMPTFITESALGQFDRFLGDPPARNVLVASLDERAATLKDVSAEDRAKFVAAAETIVTGAVIPAFTRAQALLREQLPRTNDDAGLCWLPGGDRPTPTRCAASRPPTTRRSRSTRSGSGRSRASRRRWTVCSSSSATPRAASRIATRS